MKIVAHIALNKRCHKLMKLYFHDKIIDFKIAAHVTLIK